MAIEPRRKCNYRVAGGLYLCTDGPGVGCDRLPIVLERCPHCGGGIKQTRAWTWVSADTILGNAGPCRNIYDTCRFCSVCRPDGFEPGQKVGLVWIGEAHYETPEKWLDEAAQLGISRRIAAIPKGFRIGETWVFAAHPKGAKIPLDVFKPAIVHVFKPSRIELVVTPSMKEEDWVKGYVEKGITLVEVPEDDPDHAPRKVKRSARTTSIERHAERA